MDKDQLNEVIAALYALCVRLDEVVIRLEDGKPSNDEAPPKIVNVESIFDLDYADYLTVLEGRKDS